MFEPGKRRSIGPDPDDVWGGGGGRGEGPAPAQDGVSRPAHVDGAVQPPPSNEDRPKGASSRGVFNWSIYTVAELVRFRDDITKALPPIELSKLNLEEEVLLQFHTMRELQGDVMDDKEVPVNQRAQVANTVAATLKTLAEKQVDLYSSERFKDIENLLIRTLSKLPEDLAAEFIADYEKLLIRHD